MKIMKWRGYNDDDALVRDIDALSTQYSVHSRVCALLKDLKRQRAKLCIFHVSKVCTMMRVASSIAESTHSAIKGGGEFKKLLRASNFYESMHHILQLMRIYIDDTVSDLKTLASKGCKYSPYAGQFIDHAWSCMAQCISTDQISDTEWRVVQNVPEFKGGKDATAHTLPAYKQLHLVTFHANKTHATCTCPEYTQGLRLCAAVCAVLFKQGRGSMHKDVSMLHSCWHLENHPLWCLIHDPCITFGGATTICAPLPPDITSMSLFPNDVMRLAKLEDAFHDVVHASLKSPHFERLLNMLQSQKQILAGQSLDHAFVLPPSSAVAEVHLNRGGVPDADVVNQSRMATYNPATKGRIESAQSRDPTAYSLHKRGIEGACITCDCGQSLSNNKKSRYYHIHHNKHHLEWLKSQADATPAHAATSDHSAASLPHAAAVDVGAEGRAAAVVDVESGALCCRNRKRRKKHADVVDNSDLELDAPVVESTVVAHHVSDSLMDEVHNAAPFDSSKSPQENAARLGAAAIDVLFNRQVARQPWIRLPHNAQVLSRGEAWQQVQVKASDFLPYHSDPGMACFKINQCCEDCREWKLCARHEAMASKEFIDLTPAHYAAMKAAGYCLVECGGDGDCFYHCMMFLAQLFRPNVYKKWGNHKQLRMATCNSLMVNFISFSLSMM
jgi:hypothetical protein